MYIFQLFNYIQLLPSVASQHKFKPSLQFRADRKLAPPTTLTNKLKKYLYYIPYF